MRMCRKCGLEKMPTEFHKDKSRKDGLHPYCAACQTAKASLWCREHRDRNREASRRYKVRNAVQIGMKAKAADPKKIAARSIANVAARGGALVRPERCSIEGCGGTDRLQMHHADYDRPLDVEWLCSVCHAGRHHKGSRYG